MLPHLGFAHQAAGVLGQIAEHRQGPATRRTRPVYARILGGPMTIRSFLGAVAGGECSILDIVMTTHGGMTTEEFQQTVKDWRGGR
jgi:hypothetical protein